MEGESQRGVKDSLDSVLASWAGGDCIHCDAGPRGIQKTAHGGPQETPRAAGSMSVKLRVRESLGNTDLGVIAAEALGVDRNP